jgi:CheY-like chemotaxis protein
MSGLEATAIIRARERANGGHVPILAMTARAMRGDREACLAAGMDGYVAKPIQRDVLFAEMEQWLSTPPTDPEILDPGATLDRVDGDVDLLSELAGMLCKHSPSRIAEMRAALESGDGMQLGNAVHSLRNSLGNFAAPRAYAMAGHLETMCEEGRLERAAEVLASLEQEVAQLERALLRMVAEERQASGNQAQG